MVTGGAGFIGSHVAELLLSKGYAVTVLDNLSLGNREWVPSRARFVEGDITDLDLMRQLCVGMAAVFHLAAMSRVLPSLQGGPSACLFSADQNIRGTLNLLVAAAEAKVNKLIYSASSTFYGNLPPVHHEALPPGCHTPYAISKYTGELYALQFHRMYQLPVVCLRYFQVYGPRQPVTGEYAMVTGIFIDQWLKGQPLTIHGDGSQRRDFVHVHDVAKANVLAFEKDVSGEVINVGSGESHSIKELADLISPKQTFTPPRPHDMKETVADIGKCRRLLGWAPEIGFVAGTRALVEAAKLGQDGSWSKSGAAR
ncbi:MAG: NAD-dependent epimerase/dehydratase family protein [Steroidobacteraceae bacterium]